MNLNKKIEKSLGRDFIIFYIHYFRLRRNNEYKKLNLIYLRTYILKIILNVWTVEENFYI